MPFVEGEIAARAARSREAAAGRRSRAHRGRDRERARVRARARRDPPRSEAREHPAPGRAAGHRRLRHRARGRNAGGARVTQTGLSLGTPQYMSPEQATGDRAIDARSDIYSLAAVTYEMLTGEPPHTGSTAQAIIARVLTEQAARARERSRDGAGAHGGGGRARARQTAGRPLRDARASSPTRSAVPGATPRAYTAAHASTAARRTGIAMMATIAALVAIAAWGWLRPRPSVKCLSARAFRSPLPTAPASARKLPERTSRSLRTDRLSSTLAGPGSGPAVRAINQRARCASAPRHGRGHKSALFSGRQMGGLCRSGTR